ncbi:hypothetical protein TWF106_006431 [Orbilia oligospora]|uniref:Uncharacterized protein n=1 Tax=Orbilia oligospora TaxID=2813651 RepID=A0A7C8QQF6_ORBOL|nr:hypothetical protein TWF106_006431 [Orbilia oligospora]
MSQDQYWKTILQAGSSTDPCQAHEHVDESESERVLDTIPALAGSYIQHDRIRTALGIPIKGLHHDTILKEYPNWPSDVSPDASWTVVLDVVKESLELYCDGVVQDEKLLQWSLSPHRDLWSHQSPILKKAIVKDILSNLRAKGYGDIANRLSRCDQDWAIKDLLQQKVRASRKKERERQRTAKDPSTQ